MLIIRASGAFFGIILWNGNWTSLWIVLATGVTCAAYASLRCAMCELAPYVSRLNLAHAVRLFILNLLLFTITFFASLFLPF